MFCLRLICCNVRKTKENPCVFQLSSHCQGFCCDPKHFIVKFEEHIVKCAEKMGANIVKNAICI